MVKEAARSSGVRSAVAIASVFSVICLWLAGTLNIWIDEVYSLATTSRSLGATVKHALTFEAQPPLYFVLLKLWRSFGDSLLIARSFSVLMAAIAIVVVSRVAVLLDPAASRFWPALVLAVNPIMPWAATEARAYALAACLGAALTWSYVGAYEVRPGGRGRAVHVLLSVLALYTQYHLGILLAGMGLALLLCRRATWRAYALDMAIVAAAASPLWIHLPSQTSTMQGGGSIDVGLGTMLRWFEQLLLPWNATLNLLGDRPWLLRSARWGLRLIEVGAAVWVLRRLLKVQLSPEQRERRRLLPIVVIISLLLAALAASLVDGGLAVPRYLIGVVPGAMVILCVAMGQVPGRLAWLGPSGFAAPCLVACVLDFLPLSKDCDCKRVAVALESGLASADVVAVFPAQDALPLRYHGSGLTTVVPIPREPSLERYDRNASNLFTQRDVASALPRPLPASLWVYTRQVGGSGFGVRGSEHLETFLDHHYQQVDEVEFNAGVRLRRFSTHQRPP